VSSEGWWWSSSSACLRLFDVLQSIKAHFPTRPGARRSPLIDSLKRGDTWSSPPNDNTPVPTDPSSCTVTLHPLLRHAPVVANSIAQHRLCQSAIKIMNRQRKDAEATLLVQKYRYRNTGLDVCTKVDLKRSAILHTCTKKIDIAYFFILF
jgi:hypothetical protein